MKDINPRDIIYYGFIYPVIIIIIMWIIVNFPEPDPICSDPNPIVVERRDRFVPGGFLGMGAHHEKYFICKKCNRKI